MTENHENTNQNQQNQNSQIQHPDQQLIEQYLKIFRHLKYGVLEKTLEDNQNNHNKLIVVEAPRFNGDMRPVCEPAYFGYNDTTPTEMLTYYSKCEALVYQRFEQLQVRHVMESFKKLVNRIEYNEASTKAYVVFGGKGHPPFPPLSYNLNLMDLSRFIHDLMDYGDHCAKHACSGKYGIYFSTIFLELSQNINFHSLNWQIINNPWENGATNSCLEVKIPFIGLGVTPVTKKVCYSDDAEDAIRFVVDFLKSLTQRNLRDFISNPNAGR